MGRTGKISRLDRKVEPAPRPIALPEAVEQQEQLIAEARPSTAALQKHKKRGSASTAKNKKQRDKAIKAAEFAEKLETKATTRQQRKAQKDHAKKLWD